MTTPTPPAPRARRASLVRAGVGFAMACVALACSPDPPDVVLISIDTLRADRLGCYGSARDTSPNLDALAAAGARFETVMAPTSWTLPSHASLLTGLSPPAHRVVEKTDRIDPGRRMLAEHLTGLGYRSAGFVSAPFLHRAYGFSRGFEVYRNFGVREGSEQTLPVETDHVRSHGDRTADRVVDAARSWLEAERGSEAPTFLFVHLWDPHSDYAPPPPYDRVFDPDYRGDLDVRDYLRNARVSREMPARDLEHVIALYDGEIRWTDAQIGRLLETLDGIDRRRRTIVMLVSDHGEEFFEHGEKGHGHALYEESVRVPWIVRDPARVAPGLELAAPAGLEDVAPTLLDLAELPPLPEATGRSHAPALRGEPDRERPALLAMGPLVGLRGRHWKLLRLPGREPAYFDLTADPGEERPRPGRRAAAELLLELEARLRADHRHAASLAWSEPEPVELDAATRERLRELGYLDGTDPD